jgi:hypothetical protein
MAYRDLSLRERA